MDTLLYIAQFIIGLVGIVKGADWLTDGASSIARRFGIPSLVIGLTIVAMGSSAPEFVVSVMAAIKGNADIALGNVVGSNIFNILAIMGVTAMITPIHVERGNIRNDVPFVVLASIVVVITAFDTFFSPETATNSISRTDGMLMICMFAIFMSYTMSIIKGNEDGKNNEEANNMMPLWRTVVLVLVGLSLLVIGGDWLVSGASGIAGMLGVSESVIALTIVSGGTSAPELAASVMAAKKGDTAMALGNIVGSCVFNTFLILGASATICPLGINGVTPFDIITLLTASCLLWMFCRFGKTHLTLTRAEGTLLVVVAIAYYTWLVINA